MFKYAHEFILARRFPAPAVALLSLAATFSAHAQNVIPSQYIAKLYTEALGRAPDQPGWTSYSEYFQNNGCTAKTLALAGSDFYNSYEFAADNPDPESKIIALYRGVLNRDADDGGLAGFSNDLKNGEPFSSIVAAFFSGPEFLHNAPTYCGSNPGYGFGAHLPPTPTPGATGYTGGEAGLQALLRCAALRQCKSPVLLAQKAVIHLTKPLQVPQGVTLATEGYPTPQHYAQMARLVRDSPFAGPNIQVDAGASITNLWIDGQRNVIGFSDPTMNVMTLGGNGTNVSENKLSEPEGAANLVATGTQGGSPCQKETIYANLLTGYTSIHGYDSPADGMTVQCENADIENNDLVDMTDEAIVLQGSVKATQASKVIGNTIVSAGNSTNAPVSTDPTSGNQAPAAGQYVCYAGTTIENNTFWTGPYTTFDFGIAAGAREYFRPDYPRQIDISCPLDGPGPVYKNNTTGSLSARVRAGIAVAGAMNVAVSNDDEHPMHFIFVTFPSRTPAWLCPSGAVIVERSLGHASGTFPAPTVDGDLDFCIAP
jgi:hypothetical protein